MNKEASLYTPENPTGDPRPRLIAGKEKALASLHHRLFSDEIEVHMGSLQLLSANEILGIKTPDALKATFPGFNTRITPSQLMADAGSAALVGLDYRIPNDSRIDLLTYLVNYKAGMIEKLRSNEASPQPWRNQLAYAAIIGLDSPLYQSERDSIAGSLVFGQELAELKHKEFMELHPGGIDEEGFSFIDYGRISFFKDLLDQLADARIAGIEVPVTGFTMDMMEQAIMADRDSIPLEENAFFPNHAANFAIISASKINVGGPHGIELFF